MWEGPVSSNRQYPVNAEAERLLLGCVLRDQNALAEIAGSLRSEDFGLPAHRQIFLAMLALADRGQEIDELRLIDALEAEERLQSVGGQSAIVGLADGVPRLSSLDSYIAQVRNKALRREMIRVGDAIADLAHSEPDEAEAVSAAQGLAMSLSNGNARRGPVSVRDIIAEAGGVAAMMRSQPGIPTGFPDLDYFGGLIPGELIIVGARPSMGKTALAFEIGHQSARRKHPVLAFSLEMSKEQLVGRMACGAARVNLRDFIAGDLEPHMERLVAVEGERIAELPFMIDESGTNPMDVLSKCRSVKSKHGLDVVVIDYLQLMSAPGAKENRNLELGHITRQLKLMARELSIAVVLLSQLARDVDKRPGRRPILADLRDSGSIEQDADKVLFLLREHYYDAEKDPTAAELIIAKNRNGPTGSIELNFSAPCVRFDSVARRDDAPAPTYNDQEDMF